MRACTWRLHKKRGRSLGLGGGMRLPPSADPRRNGGPKHAGEEQPRARWLSPSDAADARAGSWGCRGLGVLPNARERSGSGSALPAPRSAPIAVFLASGHYLTLVSSVTLMPFSTW